MKNSTVFPAINLALIIVVFAIQLPDFISVVLCHKYNSDFDRSQIAGSYFLSQMTKNQIPGKLHFYTF